MDSTNRSDQPVRLSKAPLSVVKARLPRRYAHDTFKSNYHTLHRGLHWADSNIQYTINCSQPASDKIFDVSAFEKFLHDKIKVDGRTGNLGETIVISQKADGKIEVVAHQEFSGRYLKYMTKKYLKKQQLRDWLRVVSTSVGNYELRFYNVVGDDQEEEED